MSGSYSHKFDIANSSANTPFEEIGERMISRRRLLKTGAALSFLGFPFAQLLSGCRTIPLRAESGFGRISPSTADTVRLPTGYSAQVFYRWGDPIGAASQLAGVPAFKLDHPSSAAETLPRIVTRLREGLHEVVTDD